MRRRSSNDVPEWVKNKRDDNEAALVALMRQLGAGWNACSRHEGHDGWVIRRGVWRPVEVKNPSYRWDFTASELRFMEFCERYGSKCYVLETKEDVINMLNDS